MILQQDRAPTHYLRNVGGYLNETFPSRWIGQRGGIEWPLGSTDFINRQSILKNKQSLYRETKTVFMTVSIDLYYHL